MSIELKYTNEDKTPNSAGWILEMDFLKEISQKVDELGDCGINSDLETIEAILLIANGEGKLLKTQVLESDEF